MVAGADSIAPGLCSPTRTPRFCCSSVLIEPLHRRCAGTPKPRASLPITSRSSMSLSGDPRGSSWRGWGDLLAAVVREDRVQPLPGKRGHRRALFGGENFQLVPYAPGQVERDRHRPGRGWLGRWGPWDDYQSPPAMRLRDSV